MRHETTDQEGRAVLVDLSPGRDPLWPRLLDFYVELDGEGEPALVDTIHLEGLKAEEDGLYLSADGSLSLRYADYDDEGELPGAFDVELSRPKVEALVSWCDAEVAGSRRPRPRGRLSVLAERRAA